MPATPEKLASFRQDWKNERFRTHMLAIRVAAESAGGDTLKAWRAHLGAVWGDGTLRTQAEVAQMLGWSLERVHAAMDAVDPMVGHIMRLWEDSKRD